MQSYAFKQRQQGATLIVALVFLVVLTAAGVTAMRFASVEERMASNSQFRNQTLQLVQSELRAQLLAFNQNLANRAPLLASMNISADNVTDTELLAIGRTRGLAVAQAQLPGVTTTKNLVSFMSEKPCEDGSNVEKYSCLDFELNVQINNAGGASSWQSQGIMFQNNK